MRQLDAGKITETVRKLFIRANYEPAPEIEAAVRKACCRECSAAGRAALQTIAENFDAARETNVPLCQDTGMAVVFLDIGQDVHITGGDLTEAINQGVHEAYIGGYLRCSVVADPIRRGNTGDNTPAIVHTRIVPGEKVCITAAPKGFGSENMSTLRMFTPSASREDIIGFVADAVKNAGSNPCPPVIVGVGIGGTFEMAALLAKRALIRPISCPNDDPFYAELEKDMLEAVNKTGVGPQGFGGIVTALGVNIEKYPTHIAGLPVAVNMSCHATRHESETI